jgi:hypothetical protein
VEVLRLEDRLIVVTDTAGAICEHHSDASYIHQPKRG